MKQLVYWTSCGLSGDTAVCEGLPFKECMKIQEPLRKLYKYQKTGVEPEEIPRWIPCIIKLPDDDRYILLSFANCSIPMIGRYHDGAFYLGDCDDEDTCSENDLFVNAWMELPKPYDK